MREPLSAAALLASPLLIAAAPAGEPALDDQIRNAASLVSIALALLTLFTNRRLTTLDEQRATLGSWDMRAAASVGLDAVLLLGTTAVLVSVSPLIVEAWPPELARQDAVLRNLLLIAGLGLLGVGCVQAWVLATQVFIHSRNTRRERRRP